MLTNLTPDQVSDSDFPVLVKASAGGGGRGMRVVRTRAELQENLETAEREAKSAFGEEVHQHILNSAEQEWLAFNRAVTSCVALPTRPLSCSALFSQSRRVSPVQPILAAIEVMAAHRES